MCELKSQQSAGETKALLTLSLPDACSFCAENMLCGCKHRFDVYVCSLKAFIIGSLGVRWKIPRSAICTPMRLAKAFRIANFLRLVTPV